MTRQPHLDPSPFFLEGGSTGVLLLHGFTGSPPEMRLVGDYLHRRGLTVSAPLLPGHGTSADDLNRCAWCDWTEHAEQALADLRSRCEPVFIGGFSMGSLIALYLAAQHPELPGIILYAPATIVADRRVYLTPILKYLIPKMRKSGKSDLTDPEAHLRFWSYEEYPVAAAHEVLKLTRQVRRLLPRVTCPLLIMHGIHDQAIHPRSPRYTYERAGSADKESVTLYNSGHGLVVDSEWETVAHKTLEFVEAHR
jgi:carboxylesterase